MSTLEEALEGPAPDAGGPAAPPPAPVAVPAAPARPRRRWRLASRLIVRARRDPQSLLTVATAIPVLLLETIESPERRVLAILATLAFLAFDAAAAALPRPPLSLPTVRLGATLAYIVVANAGLDTTGTWPLAAMFVPAVALAAARGGVSGSAIVFVAITMTITLPAFPVPAGSGPDRRWATAIAELIVGLVSRRLVEDAERATVRARRAHRRSRRRATGLAAVEEVGRLLAREGTTPAVLDRVMGLFEETFGYRYPSIYFWDGAALRLAAHRNYRFPIAAFGPDRGVLGRVVRTRRPAFIPDVAADPDFLSADPQVTAEISVPLLSGDELLGVMNVESGAWRRLDADDFATMLVVGDRIAAAMALGRERTKLAERTRLLDRLTAFATALGATLDPSTIHAQVATGASRVVDASMVVLVRRDDASGEYRVVEVAGRDGGVVGMRILPGEGLTGRALVSGEPVVEAELPRSGYARDAQTAGLADVVAAMSVPLVADGDVRGALSWFREDLAHPFTDQEREIAQLLAAKVVLALANADLHEATREAAVTDALTGLHNRRYFDAAIAHAEAARARVPAEERQPRSAILFDLDHFGDVNKERGFAVGDRVLRRFADTVRARVRAADLVARIGGEEFMIVLEGATAEDARRVAEGVRTAFAAAPTPASGGVVAMTVSAGVTELAPEECESRLLVERADSALRRAKRGGRDRVAVSYPSASGTPRTLNPPST